MATKPTDRILDWASGGSATDPGGAKEANGWIVDERPPAFWWNWILNSFGQWLSWSETSIDDIETKTDFITVTQDVDLDALEPLVPTSLYRVDTGQGTPAMTQSRGIGATPTLLSAGLGDTGGTLRLTYSSALTLSQFIQVTVMDDGSVGDLTAMPVLNGNTSTYCEISFFDDTGTILDLDDVVGFHVHVVVWE